VLRRPLAAVLALLPALLLVFLPGPAEAATVWHVVAPGETASSIARAFHLRLADLGRWNQLVPPYPVHVDEALRLTRPPSELPAWRSRIEPVTTGMITWDTRCPVAPANLRKVWVSYLDLQGNYHDGSIVARSDLAVPTQRAFFTLFRWRYRIMAMAPMSVNMPGVTDMGNVTAGYNCRPVGGTDVWSEHAFGTEVDINPLQNPMVRNWSVSPAGGRYYLNRDRYLIGMIHPEGAARAFTADGYFWGGHWRSLKDYMHFSVTNR
jgi:LysM repeat protein